MCCICGANYYRSQMTRKQDGMLYCRDDAPGMIAIEETEALNSQSHVLGRRYLQRDGGSSIDHDVIVSDPYVPPLTPSGEDPLT